MTKEIRSSNDESRLHNVAVVSPFEFRHSFGFRHSLFGFENITACSIRKAGHRTREGDDASIGESLRVSLRFFEAQPSRPQPAPTELGHRIVPMPVAS